MNTQTIGGYEAMLKEMRIGERKIFAPFWVKRKSRDSYCLFESGNHYRSRWGNAKEIGGDLATSLDRGHLVASEDPAW